MAGCSKKQYAIMMSAGPEGKKLASEMGGMEQDKFNEAFAELLNSDSYKPAEGESKYSREEDEDYREFDETNEDDFGFDEDDNQIIDKNPYTSPDNTDFRKGYKNQTKMSEEEFKSQFDRYGKGKAGYDYYSYGENKGYVLSDEEGTTIGFYDLNDGTFYYEDSATEKMKPDAQLEATEQRENSGSQDNKKLYEAAIKEGWLNEYDPESHDLDDYLNDLNEVLTMHDKQPISKEEFEKIIGNTENPDGTRGEPGPGPHSMRDYVYERNHPDLGEDKRPQMNRNRTSDSDNLNPDNPKYKGFQRSSITNAELVDEGYEFTDADTGEKRKESIISYIPYGSLVDGDNRRIYALVNNYDGTDTPKTGAIVAHSLEDAKEQLESQTQLGIQGRDRYLKRGQYDEDYFNLVRDNREPGDDEKYKERYGWDFNKPFAEHDFMKNDPYEKWKSDRIGNRKGKVGDRELSLNELIEKTNKLDDRELARDIIAIQAPKFNLSEKEILDYYDKVGKK